MNRRVIKKIVQYVLMILSVLMVLTGLGITEPGIIGPVTGGILGKMLSYRIHFFLWGPFAIALIIHVYLSMTRRSVSENCEMKE